MTTESSFGPVDHGTASLLDLLAETNPATPEEVREWNHFIAVLEQVAGAITGLIDQNDTRPLLRGEVKPNRVGAFFRRAALEGLIRADGWTESNDLAQRNRGKPMRRYRWLGTQTTAPADAGEAEAGAVHDSPVAPEGVSRMREDTTWP